MLNKCGHLLSRTFSRDDTWSKNTTSLQLYSRMVCIVQFQHLGFFRLSLLCPIEGLLSQTESLLSLLEGLLSSTEGLLFSTEGFLSPNDWLTACNIQCAGLLIEGEECQMHGAGAGDGYPERREGWLVFVKIRAFSPYAVENIPVRKDSDVQVRSQNVVESTNFFISEKSVRHPHFAGICEGQVSYSF